MEAFAELIVRTLCPLIWAGFVLFVDRQIVTRRDFIVGSVRTLQPRLRIPCCLRVVSDLDPGMLDRHIYLASVILIVVWAPVNVVVPVVLWRVPEARHWGNRVLWIGGVAYPVGVTVVVSVWLVCARRKLERRMVPVVVMEGDMEVGKNSEAQAEAQAVDFREGHEDQLRESMWVAVLPYTRRERGLDRQSKSLH